MSSQSSTPAVRHQRVGWLELFYDLVFVVVIERLTHLLHEDPSGSRIAATIGMTIIVWFAWFNVTSLTNVLGGIGPRGRPFMFASMAGVGVLALGVEPLTHGHPWLFALGYAIARTAIWPLWWHRAGAAGRVRPVLWGPGLSALWLLTPLVPAHLLPWALVVLVLAEMNLSILRPGGENHAMPSISGPHMVERLGLFLMIVLGESVVQIVNSLDTERSAWTWATAALSMALMCALWWLIYEATMEKAELAVEKPDVNPLDFIGGSQLGIVAGLVLLAAGVADAIHGANHEHGAHLHHGALVCLCLGLIMIHMGTRSLTRQAFAIDLGLPKRRKRERPHTDAEREESRAELERRRAEQKEQRANDPRGTVRGVISGLAQLISYLVPVVLVWVFGAHWAPWVVIAALLAYVVFSVWVEGYGERRIRAYLESGGTMPGRDHA